MTTTVAEKPIARTAPGGTVFDIGYQRYTGPREGRFRSRFAVVKDGVRTALGLGRGPRAKVLPWFFITILVGLSLIMVLVAGVVLRSGGDPSESIHTDYYGIASIILFVFAAVVAPDLLCQDRREGVINLYLVRPLTGSDYLVARSFAFLTVMLAATWVPQLVLLFGRTMDSPSPLGYLANNWLAIPRFLAAGLVLAAYFTGLALLAASFTTRRAYASVFLVGLFAISTPFTAGLAPEIGGMVGQWISMFNVTNIPVHVNDLIFGEVSEITEGAPAGELPASVLVGWYFAWILVPAGILWLRYRRLTP